MVTRMSFESVEVIISVTTLDENANLYTSSYIGQIMRKSRKSFERQNILLTMNKQEHSPSLEPRGHWYEVYHP